MVIVYFCLQMVRNMTMMLKEQKRKATTGQRFLMIGLGLILKHIASPSQIFLMVLLPFSVV